MERGYISDLLQDMNRMVFGYCLVFFMCELVTSWFDQYELYTKITESNDTALKNTMFEEMLRRKRPSNDILIIFYTVSVATVLLVFLTRRFMKGLEEKFKDVPKLEMYRLFMMIWLTGVVVLGLLNMTILHYFLPEAQTTLYQAYITSALSVFWTYSCQPFFHSASIDYRFPFRVDWLQIYRTVISLYIFLKVTFFTDEYILLPQVYFCLFCIPCIFDFYFVYIGWIKVSEQANQ